jgi:SPP1 family predicted phage head-tail adaptor
MIRAGRLKHRVIIQSPVVAKGAAGGEVITWVHFRTVYAGVEPRTAKQIFTSAQLVSEISHVVIIRFIPGLSVKQRILYGTRIFEIKNTIDVEEKHERIEIHCKEVQL